MTIGDIWYYVMESLFRDRSSGMLRPTVFNSIVQVVNAEMFSEVIQTYETDRQNTDSSRPFVVTVGDPDNLIPIENGVAQLPPEYQYGSSFRLLEYYDSSCSCDEQLQSRGVRPIELTDEQFTVARDSTLNKPTLKRPILTIQNNAIRVLPVQYRHLAMTYLRKPVTPFFDWTIVSVLEPSVAFLPPGGVHNGTVLPVGTPSRTVELEWVSETDQKKFAEKCLFYAARRLKDPILQLTRE